jgi:GntR family transcriptional repressor for pyruvate dehydrogenase complex
MARISSGEFAAGDKLPREKELMVEYGVGRNTVREAVQGLVAMKMLDVRPHHGATVLSTSPEHALPHSQLVALMSSELTEDLYEMRLLLETEAAALCAIRGSTKAIHDIRRWHSKFEEEMRAGKSPWECDLAFHDAIARGSGNSVLPLMLGAAADLLARDRAAAALLPATIKASFQEHTHVLAAIEARDSVQARELMASHIQTASGYVDQLRRKGLPSTGGSPLLQRAKTQTQRGDEKV